MQAINITDRSTLQYRENEGTIYTLVHPSHNTNSFLAQSILKFQY